MPTAIIDKAIDLREKALDDRETHRDRGPSPGGPRARTWVILGAIIVVTLGLIGAGVWFEVTREVGQGPNAFVLASGSLDPGHITYQYNTFNGLAREKTGVTAGQTIDLHYMGQASKGSLSFEVKDPVGNSVWRANVPLNQTRSGATTIHASKTGQYQVIVTGLDTGGEFDVSWGVK